jgi:hypothetical protein
LDYIRFNVERDDCIYTGVMNYARAKDEENGEEEGGV